MEQTHPVRLFRGLEPATLATRHPGWAEDVRAFGPWRGEQGGFLAAAGAAAPVWVLDECPSALDVAWELCADGALPEWGAVLAVSQASGRGQLRRHWVSAPGNLHVAVRFPVEPKGSGWTSLAPLLAGWLFCRALGGLGEPVRLKWPNDLLVDAGDGGWAKTGGMLLEERGGVAVVGAGLNLVHAPQAREMRGDAAHPAGILPRRALPGGPLGLWRALVKVLKNGYKHVVLEGVPSAFVKSVETQLAHMGTDVLVSERQGESYRARIVGLSPEGGLRLLEDGAERILFSGSFKPL